MVIKFNSWHVLRYHVLVLCHAYRWCYGIILLLPLCKVTLSSCSLYSVSWSHKLKIQVLCVSWYWWYRRYRWIVTALLISDSPTDQWQPYWWVGQIFILDVHQLLHHFLLNTLPLTNLIEIWLDMLKLIKYWKPFLCIRLNISIWILDTCRYNNSRIFFQNDV